MTCSKYYNDEDLSEIVIEVEVETSQTTDFSAEQSHISNVDKFATSSDESSSDDEGFIETTGSTVISPWKNMMSEREQQNFQIDTIPKKMVHWSGLIMTSENESTDESSSNNEEDMLPAVKVEQTRNIVPNRKVHKKELYMTSSEYSDDDSRDDEEIAVKVEQTRNNVPNRKIHKKELYMTSSDYSDDESSDDEEIATAWQSVKFENEDNDVIMSSQSDGSSCDEDGGKTTEKPAEQEESVKADKWKKSYKRIERLPASVFENEETSTPSTSSLSHTAGDRWKMIKKEKYQGVMIKKEPIMNMLSEYYFTDESSSNDEGAIDTNNTDPTWNTKKRRDQPSKSTKPKKTCKKVCKKKQSKVCPKIIAPKKEKKEKTKRKQVRTKSYSNYKCDSCSLSFVHLFGFQKHKYTVHGIEPDQGLTCDKCPDISFLSLNALQMHIYTHRKKELECYICKQKCHFKSQMERHMRVHLNIRPHKCQYCQATFTQSGNLNAHIRVHKGDQPFGCDLCSKRFSWRSVYAKHLPRCVLKFGVNVKNEAK